MCSPNLTWRDVQYLIAYTSNRDSLSGGAWSTNGAGLRVSHKFGFGALDAEAMVTRAKRWINVPPQHSATVYPSPSYGYVMALYIDQFMRVHYPPQRESAVVARWVLTPSN